MTTETRPSLAPTPPLRVGWGYHEYAGVAYMTHDGRIQAWATVKTPDQSARIERLFERLTTRHTTTRS